MRAIMRVRARVPPDWGIRDLGFDATILHRLISYGRHTQAFAFLSLVQDKLIFAEHCFQGVNRPLFDSVLGEVGRGDNVYVYSYSLSYDVIFDHAARREKVIASPEGQVYMVLVSPASDQDREELDVHGWINWWNWVREDSALRGAPVNPGARFAKTLWSTPKGQG